MSTKEIERKHPVSPEEVGRPLSQEEMLVLLEKRKTNQAAYKWFLGYSKAKEVFESLRSENTLVGSKILEKMEQPDASEIRLELRWPVKSAVVSGEYPSRNTVRKAKSYPATYSYVTINFNRVQPKWSPDYGSEPTWEVSIEGERVEDILWVGGSLQPWKVEKAIKGAFSNPKTRDFEASPESAHNF
jgi:hypothetical protein